jgi:peptidylprolyl isomerase
MSKPDTLKNKTGAEESNRMIPKSPLIIALGVFIIIGALAVAASVLLAPGANPSLTQKPVVPGGLSGTGSMAAAGDSVSVYYTGMFPNGTVFDSVTSGTPMTFTVGSHQVITGFENAIIGLKAGQATTVNLPVEQAYGPYHPEYIHLVNRTGPLATLNLTKGDMLTYRNPSTGVESQVMVLDVTPETLTIDGNHPLAGQPLIFTIQLVSVNPGTGPLPGKTP